MTLLVFHLETSGNDNKKKQFENILLISITFLVFHLEISGNDIKIQQFENIRLDNLFFIFYLKL